MAFLQTRFLLLILLPGIHTANAQGDSRNMEQEVLQKGIADSLVIFGKWTKDGDTEKHVTYLGQLTTKRGSTFKIVNSILFWGLSKRATSQILVFNEKNQYVGHYTVTTIYDLPDKLRNENLIFLNKDKDCDKNVVTTINLRNGLPKQFFRKCKENVGDFYVFGSD